MVFSNNSRKQIFNENKSKQMICKFCGESRKFLMYIYDNERRYDFFVCAKHWNELYFEELTDQLEQNEQLES